MWLISLLIITLSFEFSYPTPNGADTSACENMFPAHGNFLPQLGPAPVSLEVSSNLIANNGYVNFTIQAIDGFSFAGFLAQARSDTEGGRILGTFSLTSPLVRTLNCPLQPPMSVVTHTSPVHQSQIFLHWVPPADFTGVIRFL